jgi:hypothetical protein
MADLARGFTFSDTDVNGEKTVTQTNLVALIASAGASQFGIAEFKNLEGHSKSILTQVEDAASGPTTTQSGGTAWYDSTLDFLRVQQGDRYDGQFDYIHVKNGSASETVTIGMLVKQTGVSGTTAIPEVVPTAELANPDTLGISLAEIAPSGTGILRKQGMMEVWVSGAVTSGDLLVSSSQATGTLESIFNVSGYPTVTFGLAVGQCFKSLDGTVSPTLVTCMVFL